MQMVLVMWFDLVLVLGSVWCCDVRVHKLDELGWQFCSVLPYF
jgi:hypothetical protein